LPITPEVYVTASVSCSDFSSLKVSTF